MKSQVSALLHVLQGLIKDILAAYPGMQGELEKDLERIALYARTRGLGFFCLDLPHLHSLLQEGLESGRLLLDGPISQRVSKRAKVPRLFAGLWLRVFDANACLKLDADANALFFLIQVLTLGKKIEQGVTPQRLQATVRKYHDIEDSLRPPTLAWEADELCREHAVLEQLALDQCVSPVDGLPLFRRLCENDRLGGASGNGLRPDRGSPLGESNDLGQGPDSGSRRDKRYLTQAQETADLIVGAFAELCPSCYALDLYKANEGIGFRHGPGAVAERLKNWEKSQFPNWPLKLQNTFPFELCGSLQTSPRERPPNHEVASRLIAVPKTMKGPRLIAAEPVAHQWCQQIIRKFLVDQCEALFGDGEDNVFIDFSDQQKSGDMVLTASLDRKLATVDLSDASDRLTCWTVERVFRRNKSLLVALHAARTRYIRDEISDELGFLKLKKFASQGTATTFPVMSIVMLILAISACIDGKVTWQKIRKLRNQVRVFGDDIILPSHGYDRLVRLMDLLQLKVNVAKSYVNGHFRESCGIDGYRGLNIVPVKPKTLVGDSPASRQAIVDTSNNLFNKGLWNAATACENLLPIRVRRTLRVVGRNDAGSVGLTSFVGSDESHLDSRWNQRLHRFEVRTWGTWPQVARVLRDGHLSMLDFIASKHSYEQARTVSEYRDVRNTRDGVRWEPANLGVGDGISQREWRRVGLYYSRNRVSR